MFCPKCGTKNNPSDRVCVSCNAELIDNQPIIVQKPIQQVESVQFKREPSKLQENLVVKIKNLPTVAKILTIVLVSIAVVIGVLYAIGASLTNPEKIISDYLNAQINENWDKVIGFIVIENTDSINQESFISMLKANHQFGISSFEIVDKSSPLDSELVTIFTIKYVLKSDSTPYTQTITLVKQNEKRFLAFDSYKISIDNIEKLISSNIQAQTSNDSVINHSTEPPKSDTVTALDESVSTQPIVPIAVAIGDIIRFGNYDWRVLDVCEGKMLIISEKVLEGRGYHTEGIDISWENCSLREYLNNEFLNTFSSDEKSRILSTQNTNSEDSMYNTTDKVFLLSMSEANSYFSNDNERKALYDDGEGAWWWLRSYGEGVNASAVAADGYTYDNTYSREVNLFTGGVRPALWLSVSDSLESNIQSIDLSSVAIIDSFEYNIVNDVFTDSLGNRYNESHWFAPDCRGGFNENDTAYVVYNLNKDYTNFSADIVAPSWLGSTAYFLVEITFDYSAIPIKTIENFNVQEGLVNINLDVSGVTSMTITVRGSNSRPTPNCDLYIGDLRKPLEKPV